MAQTRFAPAIAWGVFLAITSSNGPASGQDTPTIAAIQDHISKQMGISARQNKPTGILVTDVQEDSPAAKSGVRPGDVLLMANQKALTSTETLYEVLQQLKPTEAVQLTASRNNQVATITVRLAGTSPQSSQTANEFLLLGMVLVKQQNPKEVLAVVSEVTPSSPAWNAGIRKGDGIIGFDKLTPKTFEELSDGALALVSKQERQVLPVTVKRNDESFVAEVKLEPDANAVRRRRDSRGNRSDEDAGLPRSRDAVAQLLQPAGSGPAAGYQVAGRATFRSEFVGMMAEVTTRNLPAGSYVVAVLEHGDLGLLTSPPVVQQNRNRPDGSSSQPARSGGVQRQMFLGTIVVNAQGLGQLTQRLDNIRPELLAGRMLVIHPAPTDFDPEKLGAWLPGDRNRATAAGVIGYAATVAGAERVPTANVSEPRP